MLDELQQQNNSSSWFDTDSDLHPEPARAFTEHPSHSCPARSYFYPIHLSTVCWCLKQLHFQCPFSSRQRANQMMHFGSTHISLLLCWACQIFPQKLILCHLALRMFAMTWLRTIFTFLKSCGLLDLSFFSFTPATSPRPHLDFWSCDILHLKQLHFHIFAMWSMLIHWEIAALYGS